MVPYSHSIFTVFEVISFNLLITDSFLKLNWYFLNYLGAVDTSDGFNKESESVMKYVDNNIIGKNLVYESPFGKRSVIYCDYTASGK